jgi:hypothetical protein
MKRELFGYEISQKSKSEFLSATDLVRAGNYWRALHKKPFFEIDSYYKSIEFKEFEKTLKNKYGEVRQIGRGRGNQHSWVHPLIFIDIALKISPELKVEVYEWVIDNLLKYRNESGLSYKKMCGILYSKTKAPSTFYKFIEKVADRIKLACGVDDWNKADEEQLKKREKIQDNISLLAEVLNDVERAVDLAIVKGI